MKKKMYFSNKNIFIELDFIRNHRSKWLGVADLISHILSYSSKQRLKICVLKMKK